MTNCSGNGLGTSSQADQKTTACQGRLGAPCGFLMQLSALCQGAYGSKGTFLASVPFLEGEGGEDRGLLLNGLKDAILGHIITAFHAGSASKVHTF